jgi:polyhydroxybutyrate depolymerase
VVAVGAAAALSLAACGSGGASSAPPVPGARPSSSTAPAVAVSSAGCGAAAPGGTLDLRVGGRPRTVIVHLPPGYRPGVRTSLVLNFHGSGSTAQEQELFTGMDATADAGDFIVAYPQAVIADGTGDDWNIPGEPLIGGRAVPAGAPDDVVFAADLVSVLSQRYCIDRSRVYAVGFSGGARLASQLACDASNVFAAVAAVSGIRHPSPCPASRPVPVIAFHGTADPVDPYRGHGQAYWVESVPAAAADWARQNGCSPNPVTAVVHPGATSTRYEGCRHGATIELITLAGEGHEWPGGPALPRRITRRLGPQSDAVSADATLWAFFVAHPMS